MKELLYCYKEKSVDISSTTYLLCVINVVCERPPTSLAAIATVVVVVRRELAPRRVSEKRGKIHHDHLVGEQGALAGLYVNWNRFEAISRQR